VLICGLVAVVAAAQVTAPAQATQTGTVGAAGPFALSADRALAREILEELVEIPTTESAGTLRAAETIAGRLLAAGFPKEDVQIITTDANVPNVVARLRGRNPGGRGILLMAHIDVVPARREDWTIDPWTLLEREGWFYGRGTGDNKAGASMLIANLITLKRAGWQPTRDLVAVLTGDEETAQRGIQSLVTKHRGLLDADIAFNTDGGGVMVKDGRPAVFEVQASEKIYADYQLEVTDVGGHSSLVRPDNPIYTLAGALTRIGAHQFPLHLNDVTRMFFERSATTETGQTAIDMRAVAAAQPDQAAAARLSRAPFYNAQLRTTCVATTVQAGHANNALPQLARAVVNCRILPGLPGADVEAVIRRLAGEKVKVTVIEPPIASPPSTLTPALLSRIEPLVAKHWPNIPVIPVMQAGATDGMYTRGIGIPTYGVSAIDSNPDDVRSHGKDERVGVESFHKATQFWLELMRTFGDDTQ
jgi:acetylornithine deacetylase/succinyl-diaminopimelate desuccinylase-like protein